MTEQGSGDAANGSGQWPERPRVATPNAISHPALVGSTLECPSCGVSGVVHAPPATEREAPTCHGPIKAGRPVRCAEVRLRKADDRMIGGRMYVDVVSGFTFWC